MNPADLSISEAGRRLRGAGLTAVTLAKAHLDRIATRNPDLNAFVSVAAESALEAAAAADRDFAGGVDRGPLQGIPVAIKDIVDVAGLPTGCGSESRRGHLADADADVVRALRSAGCVVLGKLATYEFALVGPSFEQPAPPARNPWDPSRITGGSSSGSAAAVAGGLVRAAIGTDTGGSVRGPAAYCGVVGLKPTLGRIPSGGVVPVSPTLDHVGVLAASVEEAELFFGAIVGDQAAAARRLQDVRIAYAREWFAQDERLMPGVLSAMDDAVAELSMLGARIDRVQLPDYALMEAAGAIILHAEALEEHRSTIAVEGGKYGRQALQSLAAGVCITPDDVARAHQTASRLRSVIDRTIFTEHDALVTVTTLTAAPRLDDFRGGAPVWTPMRTLPFNVTGHPALSLPIGFLDGLPLGMQIIGRAGDEAGICGIGRAFERATDHSAQRPAVADVRP